MAPCDDSCPFLSINLLTLLNPPIKHQISMVLFLFVSRIFSQRLLFSTVLQGAYMLTITICISPSTQIPSIARKLFPEKDLCKLKTPFYHKQSSPPADLFEGRHIQLTSMSPHIPWIKRYVNSPLSFVYCRHNNSILSLFIIFLIILYFMSPPNPLTLWQTINIDNNHYHHRQHYCVLVQPLFLFFHTWTSLSKISS